MWIPCPAACRSVTHYQQLNHLSYFHEIWYTNVIEKTHFVKICAMTVILHVGAGVHKFSKNVGATSKFQVPEGCSEAISTLRTHGY
jgi:hypothetical protein